MPAHGSGPERADGAAASAPPVSFHDSAHRSEFREKDLGARRSDAHALVATGVKVAHVFNEGGWAVGRVTQVGKRKDSTDQGHVAWVKYPDASFHYAHSLKNEDYGTTWLIVERHDGTT